MNGDCFWRALSTKIPFFKNKGFSAVQVRDYLVENNHKTNHVLRKTTASPLKPYTAKRMQEHAQWREHYRKAKREVAASGRTILTGAGGENDGHLCGIDDPFLALCCELFKVHIVHTLQPSKYAGAQVEYIPTSKPSAVVRLVSNSGHMH